LTATIPDYGRSKEMEKQKSEGEKTIGKPDGDESIDEGYVVDEEEAVPKSRSATSSSPLAGTAAALQTPPVQPVFGNSSPTSPTSAPSSPIKEKRGSKFGIASLLRNKRSRTQSSNSATGISPSSAVIRNRRCQLLLLVLRISIQHLEVTFSSFSSIRFTSRYETCTVLESRSESDRFGFCSTTSSRGYRVLTRDGSRGIWKSRVMIDDGRFGFLRYWTVGLVGNRRRRAR